MTSKRRQRAERLSPEKRRTAILEVARNLIRTRGYDEVGMADIAAALGVVEGTLYRYFENKNDLLLGVVSDWYQHTLKDVEEELRAFERPREQLRYMVWQHLDLIHRDPDLANLVFLNIRSRANYRETIVYQLNRLYVEHTHNILAAAVERGELRSDVPLSIVRDMLFGAVEHHAFTYLRGEGDFSPTHAADCIVDIVYRGMSALEPQPASENVLARFAALADRISTVLDDHESQNLAREMDS